MTTKYSKDCITKNIVFIKENIASVDRLLDILLQEDVIKWQEMEDVKAKLPGERVHHMIDIVLKKRAQHIFINALEKTGQKVIVDKISNTQKDHAHTKEPKPHTMSSQTPKVSTFATFYREHTSSWQQKENMTERKSRDEYKILLEKKRTNEVKIKQLEFEMEKSKKTENKYRLLQQEYRDLKTENEELKAKVVELKNQLKVRDEIIKTNRDRTSILQNEVDSPVKNLDRTIFNLIKSQENLTNKLMNAMEKGQQQLERKFAEATDKTEKGQQQLERKFAEATDKMETATAKLAEKIDKRLDGHDGREPTSKYSGSTHVSEMTLPPLNKLGKHFSDGLTRQNTFMDGVGVPHKFKE